MVSVGYMARCMLIPNKQVLYYAGFANSERMQNMTQFVAICRFPLHEPDMGAIVLEMGAS